MHAVGLAREFGIKEIVVPPVSGAFSAYGCVLADMSYTRQRTVRLSAVDFDAQRFERIRAQMVAELSEPLRAHGVAEADQSTEYIGLLRYEGQSSTVPVPIALPLDLEALARAFTARHEDLYGYSTAEPWLMEGLRVRAWSPSSARLASTAVRGQARPVDRVSCWFEPDAPSPTPRYDRAKVGAGQRIAGPAIIRDAWSTVVLPPGWRCEADALGNLFLTEDAA
jgi:N-methylhydantoinase A